MRKPDPPFVALIVIVLLALLVVGELVAGIAIYATSGGKEGHALIYGGGMVLMVALMGIVGSRKR